MSGEQAEFPFTYDDDDGAELEDLGPLGVAIVCGLAHVGNAALCAVILVGAVVLAPVQRYSPEALYGQTLMTEATVLERIRLNAGVPYSRQLGGGPLDEDDDFADESSNSIEDEECES